MTSFVGLVITPPSANIRCAYRRLCKNYISSRARQGLEGRDRFDKAFIGRNLNCASSPAFLRYKAEPALEKVLYIAPEAVSKKSRPVLRALRPARTFQPRQAAAVVFMACVSRPFQLGVECAVEPRSRRTGAEFWPSRRRLVASIPESKPLAVPALPDSYVCPQIGEGFQRPGQQPVRLFFFCSASAKGGRPA